MTGYIHGEEWDEHYRGFELRINSERNIWWQVYNGTDRLYLEPNPEDLVDEFLELKPMGGRVRVTEDGSVITRKEDEEVDGSRGTRSLDDYTAVYVGELDLDGHLVPNDGPEFKVPVRPTDLSSGDLWPSVYDGSRYSFSMSGDVWWQNPQTSKRHPVSVSLSTDIQNALTRLKPEGGSFRVTPGRDVITLVRSPATQTVKEQFGDLPRVVQNIIKLRRERADLQMVPLYVGTLDSVPLSVDDPPSLTDSLSKNEQEALEGWAASLGSTTSTSAESHRADSPETSPESTGDDEVELTEAQSGESNIDGSSASDEEQLPEDDPTSWLELDMDRTEERINDR